MKTKPATADTQTYLPLKYPAVSGTKRLNMDLWLPPLAASQWAGVIVYAHGGGFSHGRRQDGFAAKLANHFAPQGIAVASIEYRLKANPPSPWTPKQEASIAAAQARTPEAGIRAKDDYCGPWFYAALEDYSDAIRFLKSPSCGHDFTGLPFIAVGASAGGIAALSLCHRPAGWSHLHAPDAAVGLCSAMIQPWRITAGQAPIVLIHGKIDRVLSPKNVELIAQVGAKKKADVRVHFTKTPGHKPQLDAFLEETDEQGRPLSCVITDLIDGHGAQGGDSAPA